MSETAKADTQKVSFKDTLNLPHTDFPIRPNAAIDDPAMISRWISDRLYEKAFTHNAGNEKYILHIGPPYANGNIHLGHAYNTILKDIITKSFRMTGRQVPVTPGWDCHGLPIEIRVTAENPELEAGELKKACRNYAQKWINTQKEEFKRLGLLFDFDRPYKTMDPSYEAKVMEAFGILLNRGFIERKNKTVPWCFHDRTVLATAEIEYKDRKDPSIYALFSLSATSAQALFPAYAGKNISFIVWTTTPWTLPLNRALAVNPKAEYALVDIGGNLYVLGAGLVSSVAALVDKEARVIQTISGSQFANQFADHAFIDGQKTPIIFDENVLTNDGTAVVHIAPGCGPQDYELGVKNNLEIFSPVDGAGVYTSEIKPSALLEGKTVTEGQGIVIKELMERGKLFHKGSITHSYPHCWRCRNGLIFRATKQWFFNLEHDDIKKHALEAIETIKFMPPAGKNFLRATVENRWEWCLSRQRVWGVPIPALKCVSCDKEFITKELVDRVASHVAHEGIEYWDRVEIKDLVADGIACACGGREFVKEHDILDVWFEAGLSHYAVLYDNPELAFPADIYLEGVDQHRGWFQSSLLTAMVLEAQAPTRAIMTHGFTVDQKGQKMSKSLGNVVAPDDIIKKVGTDGLRLWVASVGHDGDAVVSETLLNNVGEVFRKIRNTARFLLSNLYDFDAQKDTIQLDELMPIDLAAIVYTHELNVKLIDAYKKGDFTVVFHELAEFATVTLSSWYMDVSKDRLYVEKADGYRRRSAQTASYHVLDTLARIMAPIMSFTAEQLSDLYQKDKTESIHLQNFADLQHVVKVATMAMQPTVGHQIVPPTHGKSDAIFEAVIPPANLDSYFAMWETMRELRSAVLKAIELKRAEGIIKHPLEARVTLYASPEMKERGLFDRFINVLDARDQSLEDFFKEFLIVSQVEFVNSQDGLEITQYPGWFVRIDTATGTKCPRCWNYDTTNDKDGLCNRCMKIVR